MRAKEARRKVEQALQDFLQHSQTKQKETVSYRRSLLKPSNKRKTKLNLGLEAAKTVEAVSTEELINQTSKAIETWNIELRKAKLSAAALSKQPKIRHRTLRKPQQPSHKVVGQRDVDARAQAVRLLSRKGQEALEQREQDRPQQAPLQTVVLDDPMAAVASLSRDNSGRDQVEARRKKSLLSTAASARMSSVVSSESTERRARLKQILQSIDESFQSIPQKTRQP